ncbi:MAG: hypothetical protein JWR83_215 [Aeromicrobium sp.]|nr:hypothetical protein [Aeromicrobium sp.]
MTDQQTSLNRILVTVGSALAAIGIVALVLAASADPVPAKSAPSTVPSGAPNSTGLPNDSTTTNQPQLTINSSTTTSIVAPAATTAAATTTTTTTTAATTQNSQPPATIVTNKPQLTVPQLAEACGIPSDEAAQLLRLAEANGWKSGVGHKADQGDTVYCAPASISAQANEMVKQLADACRIDADALMKANSWSDPNQLVKAGATVRCVPLTIQDYVGQPLTQYANACRIPGNSAFDRITELSRINSWPPPSNVTDTVAENGTASCSPQPTEPPDTTEST